MALSACASFPDAPAASVAPRIEGERLYSVDGAALGLTAWTPDRPRAALVAVHGMNDYARAFVDLAEHLSTQDAVAVYAYDQRGFGRSVDFGRWPGEGAMIADLNAAIAAVRVRHPDLPVYVVGHSMGAAVILAAMREAPLDVEGAILAAPGVWGASRLPLLYRAAINVAATFAPGKTLTGERAGRQSTDNIPVLREMFADPHVIKETRIDAVLGVVRIMGAGWRASDEVGGNILLLYGEKDEIIPPAAMGRLAERLCGAVDIRVYPESWHLLFRDLKAEAVWRDVAAWIGKDVAHKDAAGRVSGAGPAASSCAGADGGRSVAGSVTPRRARSGM